MIDRYLRITYIPSYACVFTKEGNKYRYNVLSVKSASPSVADAKILYGVRGRLVWDESETVSSFDRWSFGERRSKKGFLAMF